MSALKLLPFILLFGCNSGKDGTDSASGAPDLDGDGFDDTLDCDDLDSSIFPDATERCNELDDDCDGEIDEVGATGGALYYADSDADGYGDEDAPISACTPPEGAQTIAGDCDDDNAAVSPAATEACNDIDDDCDGKTDETGATGGSTYYEDADGDGYGHPANTVEACAPGDGASEDNTDCDDRDDERHPDALETCDDEDDDCDGLIDEDATDSETWYHDTDGDRYGADDESVLSCTQPDGYVESGGDCDEENAAINPGRTEICDGLDNDCNDLVDDDPPSTKTWYTDADGDGYGDDATAVHVCDAPTDGVLVGGDCDDSDPAVNPSGEELCSGPDGLDNDCNGVVDDDPAAMASWYTDADSDGWGDDATELRSCTDPGGSVGVGGDCDDTDPDTSPSAEEICDTVDGVDNDCDGRTDPECPDNAGRARFEYGLDADPTYRSCDLWWDTTWTITTSTCRECDWTADVDFAYDSADSYEETAGECVDKSAADWTWSFGYDDDYYGVGMLWYYASTYRYWYPVWQAEWDSKTEYLTFSGGYYAYPYGKEYYTRYWSGYAYVSPY